MPSIDLEVKLTPVMRKETSETGPQSINMPILCFANGVIEKLHELYLRVDVECVNITVKVNVYQQKSTRSCLKPLENIPFSLSDKVVQIRELTLSLQHPGPTRNFPNKRFRFKVKLFGKNNRDNEVELLRAESAAFSIKSQNRFTKPAASSQ